MSRGGFRLPLRTLDGRIVDASGRRAKLAGVNWYGAESLDFVPGGLHVQTPAAIAQLIASLGFNAVRLPWSNELLQRNPAVRAHAVAANPEMRIARALDLFDATILALADAGLLIILDNHCTLADWCCDEHDGNGLWHSPMQTEDAWLEDWLTIVRRYRNVPNFVAVDLRNEPRSGAAWGGLRKSRDWRRAAERAGNAILAANPNLLIIVEGVRFASDLRGAAAAPVRLELPDRLVYSVHDYPWFHRSIHSENDLRRRWRTNWGLGATGRPDGVPIFIGEFGTSHTADACVTEDQPGTDGFWFAALVRFLAEHDIDWTYWPLNGTMSGAKPRWGRAFGEEETFGLLDQSWSGLANPALVAALQPILGGGLQPGMPAGPKPFEV